jgi:hypothetical protein
VTIIQTLKKTLVDLGLRLFVVGDGENANENCVAVDDVGQKKEYSGGE